MSAARKLSSPRENLVFFLLHKILAVQKKNGTTQVWIKLILPFRAGWRFYQCAATRYTKFYTITWLIPSEKTNHLV